jgi:hypothetical protein
MKPILEEWSGTKLEYIVRTMRPRWRACMARAALSAIAGPLACHHSALRAQTMDGIRQYYRGSILKKHVDRIETHIISCILNVAQDVDSDWELEVLDHKGKLRRVAQKVPLLPPRRLRCARSAVCHISSRIRPLSLRYCPHLCTVSRALSLALQPLPQSRSGTSALACQADARAADRRARPSTTRAPL